MTNKELRKIYEGNKRELYDLFIEDFIGVVPDRVRAPSLDVLQRHYRLLQEWAQWQVFSLQKKLTHNPEEALLARGMILMVRLIMSQLSPAKVGQDPRAVGEAKNNDEEEKIDYEAQSQDAVNELLAVANPKKYSRSVKQEEE